MKVVVGGGGGILIFPHFQRGIFSLDFVSIDGYFATMVPLFFNSGFSCSAAKGGGGGKKKVLQWGTWHDETLFSKIIF